MKRKCFERILSAVFIAILAFANYACDNKEEILPRDKEKQENRILMLLAKNKLWLLCRLFWHLLTMKPLVL